MKLSARVTHFLFNSIPSLLRNPRENERPIPTDNKWTFEKLNDKIGYLEIASVRIHSVVATAFHW